MLSREWRCSWSSADRGCSNYIWVINNFVAHLGVAHIRGLVVRRLLFQKNKHRFLFSQALISNNFMHAFLSAIHIQWTFCFNVFLFLTLMSIESLAQLSWHVQNIVSISPLEFGWEQNEIFIEFKLMIRINFSDMVSWMCLLIYAGNTF